MAANQSGPHNAKQRGLVHAVLMIKLVISL